MNSIFSRPLFFNNGGEAAVNFGGSSDVNFGGASDVNFGSENIKMPEFKGLFSVINKFKPTYTADPVAQTMASNYGGYVPDPALINQDYYNTYEQRWQVSGRTPSFMKDGKQITTTPIKDDSGRIIGYTDASGVDRLPGAGLPNNAYSMAASQGFANPTEMNEATFKSFLDRGLVDEDGYFLTGPIRGLKMAGAKTSIYDKYTNNQMADGGEVMQDPNMMMGAAPQGLDSLVEQVDPTMMAGAEQQAATEAEAVGRDYLSSVMTDLDNAEDAESVINALRGDQMPISERYQELAGIVGIQDAQATPESVLALTQPALMMAQGDTPMDSGVGGLMQNMAGDINMATDEGVPTAMGQGVGNLMMAGAQQPQAFAMGGEVVPIKKFKSGGGARGYYSNPIPDEALVLQGPERTFEGFRENINPFNLFDNRVPADNFLDRILTTEDERTRVELAKKRLAKEKELFKQERLGLPELVIPKASVPGAANVVSRDTGGLDPRQLMTDYKTKPEEFRKTVQDRADLYANLLGDPRKDKDYLQSQMLFDLAGAGLNFASGVDAQGRRASGSPAAQLAAAASGLPGTIGARIASARDEDRAMKIAAIQASEAEETARKETVAKERGLSVTIEEAARSVEDAAINLSKREVRADQFKSELLYTNSKINDVLSGRQISRQAKEAKNLARLSSELNFNFYKKQYADQIRTLYMQEDIASRSALQQAQIQEDLLELRQEYEEDSIKLRSKLQSKENKKTRKQQLKMFELTSDLTKGESQLARNASKEIIEIQNKFRSGQELNREDLLNIQGAKTILSGQLGAEKYSQWERQFARDSYEFDMKMGLDFSTLELEQNKFKLEAIESLLEDPEESGFSFGSSIKGSTLDLLTDADLMRRYEKGETTPNEDATINFAITNYTTPTRSFNPETGREETTTPRLPEDLEKTLKLRQFNQQYGTIDNAISNPLFDSLRDVFKDLPINPLGG